MVALPEFMVRPIIVEIFIEQVCLLVIYRFFVLFLLAHLCNILVEVCSRAVFASEFMIEAATEVADVALRADEEDRHL